MEHGISTLSSPTWCHVPYILTLFIRYKVCSLLFALTILVRFMPGGPFLFNYLHISTSMLASEMFCQSIPGASLTFFHGLIGCSKSILGKQTCEYLMLSLQLSYMEDMQRYYIRVIANSKTHKTLQNDCQIWQSVFGVPVRCYLCTPFGAVFWFFLFQQIFPCFTSTSLYLPYASEM